MATILKQSGKLAKPSFNQVLLGGKSNSINRLLILDKISGAKFLVDTGAQISVIPKSFTSRIKPGGNCNLFAANNTPIKSYGTAVLKLDLDLGRCLQWTFLVAEVPYPIIGADLLFHFKLLVDIDGQMLMDKISRSVCKGTVNTIPAFNLYILEHSYDFSKIL